MSERQHKFTVLRAQSGDREALDSLFKSVQDSLFRCVLQIVGAREPAEDVLQDVFVILQKNLIYLRSPEHFRAWSYRIASREALRQAKKLHQVAEVSVDVEPDTLTNEREADPLNNLFKEELGELISVVPLASRSVLVLHYTEDLTLPEVAGILGIPLGTAKSRLAYGLGLLRQKFEAG